MNLWTKFLRFWAINDNSWDLEDNSSIVADCCSVTPLAYSEPKVSGTSENIKKIVKFRLYLEVEYYPQWG